MKRNVSLATAREQASYLANQRQLKAQAKQVVDGGDGFSAIPYDVWTGMDRAGKDALAAYAMAGGKVTTDPVAFYRLRDLALDHPQAFLDTDLNDHIHQVDDKGLAKLSAVQATLRDKGADDPQISAMRVKRQSVDLMLQQLGVPKGEARSPWQQKRAAEFQAELDAQLSAYEAVTGRKAPPAEQQKMVSQVLLGQVVAAMRDTGRTVTPRSHDGGTATGPQGGERQAIIRAFKARGVSPTEDQILRAYARRGEQK